MTLSTIRWSELPACGSHAAMIYTEKRRTPEGPSEAAGGREGNKLMNSAAPFPISALTSQSDFNVTVEAFRWLLVLGFPTAVAAATVWPDMFAPAANEMFDGETDFDGQLRA